MHVPSWPVTFASSSDTSGSTAAEGIHPSVRRMVSGRYWCSPAFCRAWHLLWQLCSLPLAILPTWRWICSWIFSPWLLQLALPCFCKTSLFSKPHTPCSSDTSALFCPCCPSDVTSLTVLCTGTFSSRTTGAALRAVPPSLNQSCEPCPARGAVPTSLSCTAVPMPASHSSRHSTLPISVMAP